MHSPEGWHSRGYLPHIDRGEPQFITWRLADAMPAPLIEQWRQELKDLPESERKRDLYRRAEQYLDGGHGECVLNQPGVGRIVVEAILFYQDSHYELGAFAVMPNHVHLLISPAQELRVSKIVQSIKSYSAHRIVRMLGREGRLWQPDYFDRFIRDDEHWEKVTHYIEWNPVKAGLCADPKHWPYSSASILKKV